MPITAVQPPRFLELLIALFLDSAVGGCDMFQYVAQLQALERESHVKHEVSKAVLALNQS